jgi:hypothetical protein
MHAILGLHSTGKVQKKMIFTRGKNKRPKRSYCKPLDKNRFIDGKTKNKVKGQSLSRESRSW